MALFICSNYTTYLSQFHVSMLLGMSSSVPMGDEGCPLLERSVDEPQSFFCDHVSNQNNKVIIWKLLCPLPEFPDLFFKSIRGRIRQKILWLPTLLNWLQMNQDVLLSPILHRFEDFNLLGWHRMCDLYMHLPRGHKRLLDTLNLPALSRKNQDHVLNV
ncbi:hypothetical protein SADUNF_Sadunf13G0099900 [Salix dunnii]|uniref:Uncharacterized protein n=1 Tax=Salix dunnii TaxID=1413687 RepID=A0A835JI72_9ROSI|nr:hypothetical protein SADUNF_Sadunf13G0099900 [Salix dunnii]